MKKAIINKDDVKRILNCDVLGDGLEGGQKTVFPCKMGNTKYAAKFILLYDNDEYDDTDIDQKLSIDSVVSRVKREISIMASINSPNVVKYKPNSLRKEVINNKVFLVYLEEWIDGCCLNEIINSDNLSDIECLNLCEGVTKAIAELWNLNMVHRDIKPQNIMRRSSNGEFVLLDMGIALDLNDKSLTAMGYIVGTCLYFSPEQLDLSKKRSIDFRSDLFSLGVVMYQSITGVHPFYIPGIMRDELYENIVSKQPELPSKHNPSVSDDLEKIVLRLLDKNPNGRYRKCQILFEAIRHAKEAL